MNGVTRKSLIVAGVLIAGAAVWIFAPKLRPGPTENQLTLIDTGWESDTKFGESVYMTFQATELPEDAWNDFGPFALNLCNQFASQVVQYVKEKTGESNPASISVVVRKGNSMFGTYQRTHFAYADGACGRDLQP